MSILYCSEPPRATLRQTSTKRKLFSAGGEHGLPAAEAHNDGSDIQPEKSLREVTTMSDSAALHTAMQAVGATASLPPRKRYRRTGLEIVCQYFKLSDADLDI